MFIKSLKISSGEIIIREMSFKKGINLIVDETLIVDDENLDNEKKTGNNVGKTTVLKLIDFCLGAKAKSIYSDTDSGKQIYTLVKDYLVDNDVLITLILTEDLDNDNANNIIIEKNFLSRKKLIRKINGKQKTEDEFESELKKLLLKNTQVSKPSFRQIISHNIRYKDNSINNTLKNLDKFTSDAEYETLYLFLLGCVFEEGEEKQQILTKIKQETLYKDRLEKQQTKTAYEAALSLINDEIGELNIRKSNLNINENFENDLEELNNTKYKINKLSSELSNLNIRKSLILESREELNKNVCNIDLQQLRLLYNQAIARIENIQKTFEDLVNYHNTMVFEKIKFIEKDLPLLEKEIENKNLQLEDLLRIEKNLSKIIAKSDSFKELEDLIGEINEKYRQKGEYENVISQLKEVEGSIDNYNKELDSIDDKIFSKDFEKNVKEQINKFNRYFSSVSNSLYGERYAIKYDIIENNKKQKLYKFSSFNANLSSGKKQGEILCFDIAYIMFADSLGIPCLHFLLNDKKELMHDNQLLKVSDYIKDKNIQLVISILKDKLPQKLKNERYYVVNLSQDEKLFKIENSIL
ncbi:DUF2326 domain-containing protein [uncultured Clostridium sp.]|uniref:DUF2326 domain-containing protein n=1 Tax=uncultured Clostridium sp. TaxID=59620 RepID=UPI0028E31737|nr:DUF2326 domain-containing protein [uncultured Clostridium sp.]